MYYCLNIVTEHKNYPAAVLIRSVEPISGLNQKVKTDGPGKLCKAFKIDKGLNNTPAFGNQAKLWIEDHGLSLFQAKVSNTCALYTHNCAIATFILVYAQYFSPFQRFPLPVTCRSFSLKGEVRQ